MPEHNQRQLSKREKKLKEENKALRSEVNELKAQIGRLADKIDGGKWPPAAPEGFLYLLKRLNRYGISVTNMTI